VRAFATAGVLAFTTLATTVALNVGVGGEQALAVGHDGMRRGLLGDDATCLEVKVEVDAIGHLLVGWRGGLHGGLIKVVLE